MRATGLFFLVPLACAAASTGDRSSQNPAAGAYHRAAESGQLLYVANQNSATVSIIDMETDVVVGTVDLQQLGFPSDAKPHHIVVEPDGSFWYVSLIGANTVLKFNRANDLMGRVEFERPGMMALDGASDHLYVGRSMAAVNPPQAIGVVTRNDMHLEEIEVFFPRPHAIALDPTGERVYVGSLAVNQIATVNPLRESVDLTNLGGNEPHVFVQFAVSPTENVMVGTAQLTSRLFVFDLDRAPDMTPVDTIDVNAAPWHPIFAPDGRRVYFGNLDANTVTVVDMATRSVVAVIEGDGLAQPHGSAVSPDGSKVYISNRNLGGSQVANDDRPGNPPDGTVVVIDTATREIVKVIEVGQYPAGMGTNAPARR